MLGIQAAILKVRFEITVIKLVIKLGITGAWLKIKPKSIDTV
jgi:hypothetical protein